MATVWRDWLARHLPQWAHFRIKSSSKYLGAFLGTDSGSKNWCSQNGKYLERCRLIAANGTSAAVSLQQCNQRAVPVLGYMAQFFPPSGALLKAERWALHKILHLPFNSFPLWAFFNFQNIGGSRVLNARAVKSMCESAMARAFSITIEGWQGWLQLLSEAAEASVPYASFLAGALCPAFWDSEPIVGNYRYLYLRLPSRRRLPPAHSTDICMDRMEQSDAYAALLRVDFPPAWQAWFVQKMKRLLNLGDVDLQSFHWVSFYQTFSELPSHAAMSVLKTFANAWTTRRRLHTGEQWSCIYGCEHEDMLGHYLQCPIAMSALASALRLQMRIEPPHITRLFPLTHPWCRDDFLKLFCLFHSYHYFLSKYADRYVMRPLVSYPVVQLAMAASIRKAQNIGLV